jgi:hypothetical protein
MSTYSLSAHAASAFQTPRSYAHVGGAWNPGRSVYVHAVGSWQQVYGWPFSLTAGSWSSGQSVGWQFNQGGSVNGTSGSLIQLPNQDAGKPYYLYALFTNSISGDLNLTLSASAHAYTQSDILAVVIGGQLWLGSSASFSGTSPATWSWPASGIFSSGSTYNCSVIGPAVLG